jgi:hypothetical protein
MNLEVSHSQVAYLRPVKYVLSHLLRMKGGGWVIMEVRNQKWPIVVFLKAVSANFNEQNHQDLNEYNQQLVCVCVCVCVRVRGRGDGGRCASPSK